MQVSVRAGQAEQRVDQPYSEDHSENDTSYLLKRGRQWNQGKNPPQQPEDDDSDQD